MPLPRITLRIETERVESLVKRPLFESASGVITLLPRGAEYSSTIYAGKEPIYETRTYTSEGKHAAARQALDSLLESLGCSARRGGVVERIKADGLPQQFDDYITARPGERSVSTVLRDGYVEVNLRVA
jgi:hypothetical protein